MSREAELLRSNDEMYKDIQKLREIIRNAKNLGEELIDNPLTEGLGIKTLKITRGESINNQGKRSE